LDDIAEASAQSAERVVNESVYQRSATGGGDAKVLCRRDSPTVEFGLGTLTAHGTDEYTITGALVRNVTGYTHCLCCSPARRCVSERYGVTSRAALWLVADATDQSRSEGTSTPD